MSAPPPPSPLTAGHRLADSNQPPASSTPAAAVWRDRLKLLLESTDESVFGADMAERMHQQEQLRHPHDQLELHVAQRTQALSQALSQLRELRAHIEHVRDEERTRIAREIHDKLGSLLGDLKLDLSWLEKRVHDQPLLQRKCHGMRGLIDSAVDNVGRIITDLRPSILDHQGLWAALEWQAQDFTDSSELCCVWSMDIAPRLKAPDGPMATAVFRILQCGCPRWQQDIVDPLTRRN